MAEHDEIAEGQLITMKVRNGSLPAKVAGAIVAYRNEGRFVRTLTIGAGAINQAAKAVAIAKSMLFTEKLDLIADISFQDEMIDKVSKTALSMDLFCLPHGLLQRLIHLLPNEIQDLDDRARNYLEKRRH